MTTVRDIPHDLQSPELQAFPRLTQILEGKTFHLVYFGQRVKRIQATEDEHKAFLASCHYLVTSGLLEAGTLGGPMEIPISTVSGAMLVFYSYSRHSRDALNKLIKTVNFTDEGCIPPYGLPTFDGKEMAAYGFSGGV